MNREITALLGELPEAERAAVLGQLSDEDVQALARATETLPEFIHRVTPKYTAPRHLQPLLELIDRSRYEEVRAVVHAPPRHVKTDTILNAFAWLLQGDPSKTHAFVSYAADLSRSKSRKARMLAGRAGVELDAGAQRLEEWRTTSGGGVLATGVGGPLTGQGITGLLVVDDPVKNRVEAESETTRERVWDWFNDVAFTRLEPGSSCIVVMTRWHPADLAGKLIDERGWQYIKLPAIDQQGHALWPEQYPLERLQSIRTQVGEYTFASLYQGDPRTKGGTVFGEPRYYDRLPFEGYRRTLGIDCAYAAKKSSDW